MKKISIIIFIIALITACANPGTIQGGPKDIVGPKINLRKSTPDSLNNTNFKGKEIEISFNEAIKSNNLESELTCTPTLKNGFKYQINKNGKKDYRLKITFNDSLEKNKTYIINLGKGIQDINEGNIVQTPTFVFSTGNTLDSLKISGQFINYEKNEPIKKGFVGIYKINQNPEKELPFYYTYTNDLGIFSFKNLKKDNYKIIAFEDLNKNKLYNPATEIIAFKENNINLINSIDNIELRGFIKNNKKIKIVTVRQDNKSWLFKTNDKYKNVIVKNIDNNCYTIQNNDQLSFNLYLPAKNNEKLNISITNLNNVKFDTIIELNSILNQQLCRKEIEHIKQVQPIDKQHFKNKVTYKIIFNKPILKALESNIYLKEGKDSILFKNISAKTVQWNESKSEVEIIINKNLKDTVELVCPHVSLLYV